MSDPVFSNPLRLIDANANRAREGIRTCEDYLRFSIGQSRWSASLKHIRSDVTRLLALHFTDTELVNSRDVGRDPLSPQRNKSEPVPSGETERSVAQRGLKRAQEALRVLEEYLRASQPQTSMQLAMHRYSLYEAEQWLLCSSAAAKVIFDSTVYVLLSEALCKQGLLATAEAVLRGGAKVVQLREKAVLDEKSLYSRAYDLLKVCCAFSAVLICNDRPDIALMCGASGVHLGQNDLPPLDVRRLAAERLLIGRSTHSVEQAKAAVDEERSDYIAIGSIYETATKQGRILAGLQLAEQVSSLNLNVPVFAIGGITHTRAKEIKKAGISRIAVSAAIIADDDPETATKKLLEIMLS